MDSNVVLCAKLTNDNIMHQMTTQPQSDSDSNKDTPERSQPSTQPSANALVVLSNVYDDVCRDASRRPHTKEEFKARSHSRLLESYLDEIKFVFVTRGFLGLLFYSDCFLFTSKLKKWVGYCV